MACENNWKMGALILSVSCVTGATEHNADKAGWRGKQEYKTPAAY